uniref:Putative secreted protein n=1 Tax=Anopheles marajoara TaxID=58244 RepID=A0A2M4C8H9_9DIPT
MSGTVTSALFSNVAHATTECLFYCNGSSLVQRNTFFRFDLSVTLFGWVVPSLQLTSSHDHVSRRTDDVDDCENPEHNLPLCIGFRIIIRQNAHHISRDESTE